MTNLSNDKLRIEIANEQSRPFDGDKLIATVAIILGEFGIQEAEISIAIVDDPTIRDLNCTYLGHDYETDVISFPLDQDEDRNFLSGQLIVSADTAASVALESKRTMEDELLLYVVHGTLHLVGLDDKQPESAAKMRAAEQKYLAQMGVSYHWPLEPPLTSVDRDDRGECSQLEVEE
jgi:probable rRNA maturation factor